jgi:alkaline phosphatase
MFIAEDTKQPIERLRDVMYPGLTRKLVTADDLFFTMTDALGINRTD